MRKYILLIVKTICCILAGLIILNVILFLIFNTDSFQNLLKNKAVSTFSEKLATKVSLEKAHVNVFKQQVILSNFDLEDQQHQPILHVEQLDLYVKINSLMKKDVRISDIILKGVKGHINRNNPDSVLNYQFILDSLKIKSNKVKKERPKGDISKMTFLAHRITLEDIELQLDGKKKDRNIRIESLKLNEQNKEMQVHIQGLHYLTDNHKPRKNFNKPHHGFFDVGHLNMVADLEATIHQLTSDTLVATISKMNATDSISGIYLHDVSFKASANKKVVNVNDVIINHHSTVVKFDKGTFELPNKKTGKQLHFYTSQINGYTVLKDISRTFAPVLSNFRMPLNFSVNVDGNADSILFNNANVIDETKKLDINANGKVVNLRQKGKVEVLFTVDKMLAKKGIINKVIQQFQVKKLMMKQLDALGDIRYKGKFAIIPKRQGFNGLLKSQIGNLNFNFTIDNETHYIFGKTKLMSLKVCEAFDLPKIGTTDCNVDFRIDIDKVRTKKVRKEEGGKLPIGKASVKIDEVNYSILKLKNVVVQLESDGAVAEGNVKTSGKHIGMTCDFTYTDINNKEELHIKKPHLKLTKKNSKKGNVKEKQKKNTKKE